MRKLKTKSINFRNHLEQFQTNSLQYTVVGPLVKTDFEFFMFSWTSNNLMKGFKSIFDQNENLVLKTQVSKLQFSAIFASWLLLLCSKNHDICLELAQKHQKVPINEQCRGFNQTVYLTNQLFNSKHEHENSLLKPHLWTWVHIGSMLTNFQFSNKHTATIIAFLSVFTSTWTFWNYKIVAMHGKIFWLWETTFFSL